MNMQVKDCLPRSLTIIQDQAKGVTAAIFTCNAPGLEHQIAQQCLVLAICIRQFADGLFWYQQQVYRRLGIDILETKALVILIDNVSGYFTLDYFHEQGI